MLRRSVLALLAIAATLPATYARAEGAAAPRALTQDEIDLINAISAHNSQITTMVGRFLQVDTQGNRIDGTFYLERPGKIRFQYQKGVPLLIVAEGGALTFIDYAVKQVQRWPIKNSPLGVLLDPTRDITRYAHLVPGDDRLVTVDNTDDNRGFAVGSNLAASRGEDPLLCFVNPDGILTARCLDGLEAAFADPEVVAAGPSLGDADVALRPDGSPAFLSGCCLAVRRAAFERVWPPAVFERLEAAREQWDPDRVFAYGPA